MPRVAQGGTQMWCPSCKSVAVCTAVNPSKLGNPSGQRWCLRNHADINWFRRGRVCLSCSHVFTTAEVDEQFVDELVEIRSALLDIKANAETYVEESASASASLARLGESLSVLRALDLYQNV